MGKDYMSTRQAARLLDISEQALVRKADLLGAKKDRLGWYRWPAERIDAYRAAIAGKDLNDPTRGHDLEW